MRKLAFFPIIILPLSGCGTITVPAAALSESGESFSGFASASISKGEFSLTSQLNGAVCSGEYDPLDSSKRIYITFHCTDGRSGNADVVRNANLKGGRGVGNLSDGTSLRFVFGEGEEL